MLDADRARQIAADWRPRFVDEAAFEASWTKYFETATVPDALRLEAWLANALSRDAALHSGIVREPLVPHLSTYELSAAREREAIAAGDQHDFANPFLSPEQHAAICPRCQLGIESRRIADTRAKALGKKPLPGLANLLKTFETRAQRCPNCNQLEETLAPDICENPLWHLADIFLVLHPEQTLDDMGQIGPFMRGFLRRHRDPLTESPATL